MSKNIVRLVEKSNKILLNKRGLYEDIALFYQEKRTLKSVTRKTKELKS